MKIIKFAIQEIIPKFYFNYANFIPKMTEHRRKKSKKKVEKNEKLCGFHCMLYVDVM